MEWINYIIMPKNGIVNHALLEIKEGVARQVLMQA